MKILGKKQRRATIWVLGAFKILPTEGIKAIVGLIPIKFHLQKLASRSQLRFLTLSTSHLIRILVDNPSNLLNKHIPHSINMLTNCQRAIIKGYLINSNNKRYEIFLLFSLLYPKLLPGSRIVDNFPEQFSFNLGSKKNNKLCFQQLDEMVLQSSSSLSMAIIITDASIKNNIATSILYIHLVDHPLIKTVHHALFVTSTEAELFAIRYGINQACNKENMSKIIIITNSIHTARKIFDNKSHPYQIHTMAILNELYCFFTTSQENSIEFWEYPSHLNWRLYHAVDKDLKSFNPSPTYSCKISWDYCKKIDSNNTINQWKMTFQASDGKGRHFLKLVDDNLKDIKPSYTKGGP